MKIRMHPLAGRGNWIGNGTTSNNYKYTVGDVSLYCYAWQIAAVCQYAELGSL